MYQNLRKCLHPGFHRHLSTAEVSTALRPFYFTVHPDLFGRYPEQRLVNENSLKQLSASLQAQQSNIHLPTTHLFFYVRKKDNDKDKLTSVKIMLSGSDIRQSVLKILQACDLSTEYVDKIPKPKYRQKQTSSSRSYSSPFDENDPLYTSFVMKEQVRTVREYQTLKTWIAKNNTKARENHNGTKAIRENIQELVKELCGQYKLAEIKWDQGWNVSHIRGGLQSFKSLALQYESEMHSLRERTLVLGQFTGVSLDGHVFLGNTEVRNNWLDLIKNVKTHDNALKQIPKFEKTLSTVLRDINVKRRKFMPKVMAAEYCNQLRRLTTSLSDVFGSGRSFNVNVPESLRQYEIVVEPEAGPLMVSPTGQFITPSSCPGDQLISFIEKNLDVAMEGLIKYKINKHTEISLHKECISRLGLIDLLKDDCVTPDRMIQCCQHLLQHSQELQTDMQGIILYITSYYSVLSDGAVCIPWDWKWS